MHAVRKIVSGGQTGADRAALDAARTAGCAFGGWVPRGRWAEDGAIDASYTGLRETSSADPAARTRLNVADSDATLIVSHGALAGGAALTRQLAVELGRPVCHIDFLQVPLELALAESRDWLSQHHVQVLNVAGARSSEDSRIYEATFRLISRLLERS